MTSNERFRELRKNYFEMSMEEFGRILGISKSGVSEIESGRRNVTDQHIRLLTNATIKGQTVSEAWLRDGTGEMFIPRSRNQMIGDFLNSVMEDSDASFRKAFIEALSKLDESEWIILEKIADDLAARKKRAE